MGNVYFNCVGWLSDDEHAVQKYKIKEICVYLFMCTPHNFFSYMTSNLREKYRNGNDDRVVGWEKRNTRKWHDILHNNELFFFIKKIANFRKYKNIIFLLWLGQHKIILRLWIDTCSCQFLFISLSILPSVHMWAHLSNKSKKKRNFQLFLHSFFFNNNHARKKMNLFRRAQKNLHTDTCVRI